VTGLVPGLPIEQACYWLARRVPRPVTPLVGTRRADIAVIGAGLTGLWTALTLKELDPAADVVVLEQGVAAYGGSGRSAGLLSETVDYGHALAIAHFGEIEARRLARLGEANVAELAAFLAARGIGCDYEPAGRLLVALTPGQLAACRRIVETAEQLGVETYQLLDKDAVRAQVHSPLYLGGVAMAAGGTLDPVKLVDGLRDAVERLGVAVHERTHVAALETRDDGVRLRTGRGRVDARRAVLATSAYTHRLVPAVARRMMPLYEYILVSAPLSAEQRDQIGWAGRQGVADGRAFFNYYRLTPDDRILWGAREAVYYRGNRVDASCDHSPPHYEALQASFRRHFPALAGLAWDYAWGGPTCATTRLTPCFGRALEGRALYAVGFSGHGLGSTRLAGRILAHQALDRPSDLLDLALVRHRPRALPREPLRSWAVRTVTRALRRVDGGEEPGWVLRGLDRLGIGFAR
jgi:glycine/D-amino acid oxidase-like deaminating enzyme